MTAGDLGKGQKGIRSQEFIPKIQIHEQEQFIKMMQDE